jgi:hypothetical protein
MDWNMASSTPKLRNTCVMVRQIHNIQKDFFKEEYKCRKRRKKTDGKSKRKEMSNVLPKKMQAIPVRRQRYCSLITEAFMWHNFKFVEANLKS